MTNCEKVWDAAGFDSEIETGCLLAKIQTTQDVNERRLLIEAALMEAFDKGLRLGSYPLSEDHPPGTLEAVETYLKSSLTK